MKKHVKPEATFDAEGYPTNSTLRLIRNWDYLDFVGLVAFIKSAWHWPDWGWRETQRRIYISTGGWSGNEDVIEAMGRNFMFWSMHFIQQRVGGHYIFEQPKKPKYYQRKKKNGPLVQE